MKILTGMLCLLAASSASGGKPLNVMFIVVDDLRAELNSYDCDQIITPNLDRVAKSGIQFNRAYVQQAICCASRASFLTGCRPDSTGVDYPYTPWFKEFRNQHKPIAKYFSDLGYYSRTLGKVHHGPPDRGLTENHYEPPAPDYLLPENNYDGKNWAAVRDKLLPWEHADLPDDAYEDGQIADETIATLRRAAKQSKPFFIAPGFNKPHLPFVCPKKYFNLYSDRDAPEVPNPQRATNQPALVVPRELAGIEIFSDFPQKGLSEENVVHGLKSYYACTSFIDAQIGKILDELDKLGLADSTMVVVLSDNGFHLGEHGHWGKETCFEHSTRVPLYVHVPGIDNAGTQCNALVEYVDLFPTLLDLCGFDIPEYMEGTSFVPLLKTPSSAWKKAAFSQNHRRNLQINGQRKNLEGFTIRTQQYRFTQWRERGTDDVLFEEFYDDRTHHREDNNLIDAYESKDLINQHRRQLRAGWKKALPPGVENRSNLPKGNDSWYYQSKKQRRSPTPAVSTVAMPANDRSKDSRPNVILILSDDMGYSDLPKFGKSEIPTPNIDRLANEGVLFTDAYVTAPICVASRMGLMTGQYQQRFGVYDNIYGEERNRLFLGQTLMPQVFQQAGYRTELVGKWHLNGHKRLQYKTGGPLQRGFDEFFGIHGGDSPFWKGTPVFRGEREMPAPAYLTDLWGSEACAFIERNKSNPFFLYLAFNAVHAPMHALDADRNRFRNVEDENRRTYDGMLTAMDRSIGRVLRRLDKHGLTDDTIVIFLNDNGGGGSTAQYAEHSRNFANNQPLQGHKFDVLEGGVRVPMIMRWPGRVPSGQVYRKMVSSTDVFPTVVAAAGLDMPRGQPSDGVDLLPFVSGENKSNPHEWLCWQNRSWLPGKKGHLVPTPKIHNSAIRLGEWKLVRLNEKIGTDARPPVWRLYNLKEDIEEQEDVAAAHPEVVAQLGTLFDSWRLSMHPTVE